MPYYFNSRSRNQRGRFRGNSNFRGNSRGRFNRVNFANLEVEDLLPVVKSVKNKLEAVDNLVQSVKACTLESHSVEAQYSAGTFQQGSNLLWVPTTWGNRALFGCFWVGSSKRRTLDDADIAINLWIAATIIALRCGYSGICQLVSNRYECWLSEFCQFVYRGDAWKMFSNFFIDFLQGMSFVDFMCSATSGLKATYKSVRDVIFGNVGTYCTKPGEYFSKHTKGLANKPSMQVGNVGVNPKLYGFSEFLPGECSETEPVPTEGDDFLKYISQHRADVLKLLGVASKKKKSGKFGKRTKNIRDKFSSLSISSEEEDKEEEGPTETI